MTITIHADRRPDRAGRPIHADRRPDRAGRPIPAGRSRDRSMRRPSDPVSIAKAARELLRARARAGDDPTKVERLIRARLPEAWELLDHNALVALTRRPPEGGCHWCSAFVLAVAAGGEEPAHTESHSALLGAPCSACVRRQGIDRARRRAREEAAQVAAATDALIARRPWVRDALIAAGGPDGCGCALGRLMERDCLRMGAWRAADRWGVPVGWFTGDRAAIAAVRQHPVYGTALRLRRPPAPAAEHGRVDAVPARRRPRAALQGSGMAHRAPAPSYYRRVERRSAP